MLIQFSIENHRSIKDSAVISFAASKDKSLESYLLHPDEKRALLPAIAIYGANAAGKSNVLHALMTMKDMVVGEAAKIRSTQREHSFCLRRMMLCCLILPSSAEIRYGLRKRMRSPVRLSCIRWRPSLRERVRTSARGICKDALVRFRLSEVTAYGRNEKGIRPQ